MLLWHPDQPGLLWPLSMDPDCCCIESFNCNEVIVPNVATITPPDPSSCPGLDGAGINGFCLFDVDWFSGSMNLFESTDFSIWCGGGSSQCLYESSNYMEYRGAGGGRVGDCNTEPVVTPYCNGFFNFLDNNTVDPPCWDQGPAGSPNNAFNRLKLSICVRVDLVGNVTIAIKLERLVNTGVIGGAATGTIDLGPLPVNVAGTYTLSTGVQNNQIPFADGCFRGFQSVGAANPFFTVTL